MNGRRLLSVLGLATAIGTGLLSGALFAQVPEEESTPTLDCPSGDLIYERIDEYALDTTGGADTPEDTVENFITHDYPALDQESFESDEAGATQDEEVDFEHESGGDTLAVIETEQVGDSWRVEAFAACNSFLVESTEEG